MPMYNHSQQQVCLFVYWLQLSGPACKISNEALSICLDRERKKECHLYSANVSYHAKSAIRKSRSLQKLSCFGRANLPGVSRVNLNRPIKEQFGKKHQHYKWHGLGLIHTTVNVTLPVCISCRRLDFHSITTDTQNKSLKQTNDFSLAWKMIRSIFVYKN